MQEEGGRREVDMQEEGEGRKDEGGGGKWTCRRRGEGGKDMQEEGGRREVDMQEEGGRREGRGEGGDMQEEGGKDVQEEGGRREEEGEGKRACRRWSEEDVQ